MSRASNQSWMGRHALGDTVTTLLSGTLLLGTLLLGTLHCSNALGDTALLQRIETNKALESIQCSQSDHEVDQSAVSPCIILVSRNLWGHTNRWGHTT